jgi:hypothetical protein
LAISLMNRRESAVFFILLAIMALGFAQSMYALDAADGESGGGVVVANSLIQALLGYATRLSYIYRTHTLMIQIP